MTKDRQLEYKKRSKENMEIFKKLSKEFDEKHTELKGVSRKKLKSETSAEVRQLSRNKLKTSKLQSSDSETMQATQNL